MSWLTPRTILVTLGIITFVALFSLGQEVNRRWQYRQEVTRLQEEARALQAKVIEFEHLNNYFRTDEYQERLAREKLNYRAPGEKVVLVPNDQTEAGSGEENIATSPQRDYSNPELWWRRLFVEQEL